MYYTRFSMSVEMSRLTRDGTLPKPSRETKFLGTNADRKIFMFPVQLTTSRTGNLTRLIHILAICVTIHSANPISTVALSMITPYYQENAKEKKKEAYNDYC